MNRAHPALLKEIRSSTALTALKRSRVRIALSYGTVLLAIALCYGWLKFGVFSDREFGTLYLFSKYRLSTQFYFYAPLGESGDSDIRESSLTPHEHREEAAFHEFVDVNGGLLPQNSHFSVNLRLPHFG